MTSENSDWSAASRRPRLGLRMHFYYSSQNKGLLVVAQDELQNNVDEQLSINRRYLPFTFATKNLGFARISWIVLLEAGGSGPPSLQQNDP